MTTTPVAVTSPGTTGSFTAYVNDDPATGALQGALTETAPANDTASSGQNGRLQRIAQRLTTLIALFPVGAGTAAAATRTTLASDDPAVAILGAAADAASTTTTIKAALRGIATATGVTALDLGSGTGGSRTLRTFPDTAAAHLLAAGSAIVGKVGIDQTTPGTTNAVVISPGGYSASATFTPAASSHVANDCNGAAGTFASMGPSAGRVIINSASLEIDGGTAEATAWRLYLYDVTPPSATADDGAWDLPSGDRASFLGYIDLGTAADLGSTQYCEVNGLTKQVKLAGTSLFGYLINLTTLTPAAVAHIVKLHAVPV
jgi:hypothetical protein